MQQHPGLPCPYSRAQRYDTTMSLQWAAPPYGSLERHASTREATWQSRCMQCAGASGQRLAFLVASGIHDHAGEQPEA